ncbi:MAG: IRE (iron responsive element), partial [Pirellula sp.]
MNNRSLGRKIVYILAIVALLLPLYYLGRPASKGEGKITEMRSRYRIGQADLGKLDPTSESMRLATLGMRGIASTILWIRADYYKEEKYFDRFSATLNQIALLQPHFISVWQHQAHNLSYNVSPEFEDFRQRYEWVKKGIDYLVKGTKFNTRKPILQYELGHYVGNKLGKADEKRQYRDLFRNDNEFHQYFVEKGLNATSDDAMGPDRKPDNWLVGKLW